MSTEPADDVEPPSTEPPSTASRVTASRTADSPGPDSPGPDSPGLDSPTPGALGARLRALRKARGVPARRLAERLDISPSAVSQIERGVLQPSVSRLIAITDVLGVPLAAVFDGPRQRATAQHGYALTRAGAAQRVELEGGVVFRRLSPGRTPGVDHFESTYPPGTSASLDVGLFRHEGYEIGNVVSGALTIDFDDERVVLRAGDSISYPCTLPHRIHNDGDETAVATWLIVHP